MASFIVELWESIFTPGPTPSLLAATNATFGCLQLLLLCLLFFAYSVHFVVLSILCAGLWWSINWFATELKEAQRRQEADDGSSRARREAAVAVPPASDDSGTEVEEAAAAGRGRRKTRAAAAAAGVDTTAASVTAGTTAEPRESSGGVEQRQSFLGRTGTQSSASTEDEWEKVSESEKDK